MDVSLAVIIPVFNASIYLKRCIESCIKQGELSEIIIIDDGSNDGSLRMAHEYVSKDPRIVLLTHPNNQNLGRAASRNLGIRNAKSNWITFCDADDYYLENRFVNFNPIASPQMDGFYEVVACEYENSKLENTIPPFTEIKALLTPNALFDFLISSDEERISIIGLIVKKSILNSVGTFDESLKIAEDTDLIWRLAHRFQLQKSERDQAFIIRQVHSNNTYQDQSLLNEGRYHFYKKWYGLLSKLDLSDIASKRIKDAYYYYRYLHDTKNSGLFGKVLSSLKFRISKYLVD